MSSDSILSSNIQGLLNISFALAHLGGLFLYPLAFLFCTDPTIDLFSALKFGSVYIPP